MIAIASPKLRREGENRNDFSHDERLLLLTLPIFFDCLQWYSRQTSPAVSSVAYYAITSSNLPIVLLDACNLKLGFRNGAGRHT